MTYTVSQIAELTGLTPRTLRYYDDIGLLRPRRDEENRYRLYNASDLAALEQIVLYRSLDISLTDIRSLLIAPPSDRLSALEAHLLRLRNRVQQTEKQILRLQNAIEYMKGDSQMTEDEKFARMKDQVAAENEAAYGAELEEKYGAEVMAQHRQRFAQMTKEDWDTAQSLETEIAAALRAAVATGDINAESAKHAVDLHARWLTLYWPEGALTPQSHTAMASTYPEDERFAAYYNKITPGAAQFLADAVRAYYETNA